MSFKLCKNVGRVDQAIRIVLGLTIMITGYFYQNPLGFIGLIPFLTGVFQRCPAYSICKIDTTKINDANM